MEEKKAEQKLDLSPDEDAGEVKKAAKAAEAIEMLATFLGDVSTYTYKFKEPFNYKGHSIESLTFDWTTLTGEDCLAIEKACMRKGTTVVEPAYTSDYLVGMAVRACTDRDAEGKKILTEKMMNAFSMGTFHAICNAARNFLVIARS